MKLFRIRFAFPWRIALILALLLCLPSFGFWAWSRWEVPPLQRYYLIAYWHSSEHADQPGARTQIRWLMETAPGRKRQWLFALDVAKGSQSDLPFNLLNHTIVTGVNGIYSQYANASTSATSPCSTAAGSATASTVPSGSVLQGCISPYSGTGLSAFRAASGTNNSLYTARQLQVAAKFFF